MQLTPTPAVPPGSATPAAPPPTPLALRTWRREAQRAVRLAAVAVREARSRHEAASERGHTALAEVRRLHPHTCRHLQCLRCTLCVRVRDCVCVGGGVSDHGHTALTEVGRRLCASVLKGWGISCWGLFECWCLFACVLGKGSVVRMQGCTCRGCSASVDPRPACIHQCTEPCSPRRPAAVQLSADCHHAAQPAPGGAGGGGGGKGRGSGQAGPAAG